MALLAAQTLDTTAITSIVSTVTSTVGSICTMLVANPILMVGLGFSVVALGVGLVKRFF